MFTSGWDYTGWGLNEWLVVGGGVLVVLILLIIVIRVLAPKKYNNKSTSKVEIKQEPKIEIKKEEPKVDPAEPQIVVIEEQQEPKKEEPKSPAVKKDSANKSTTKTEPKSIKKDGDLKDTEGSKKRSTSAKYHISQNKDTDADHAGEWRVRKEGSEKTIKFFKTQKEAIEYAEKLAENQDSSIVIHKKDGSIRKQDYKKKV